MSHTAAQVCQRCGHNIPSSNISLHELRCQLPIPSAPVAEPSVEAQIQPSVEAESRPSTEIPSRRTGSAPRSIQTSALADRGWACSKCTFHNDPSLFRCEMCGTPMVTQPLSGFASCPPTGGARAGLSESSTSQPRGPPISKESIALSSMGGAALGAIAGGISNWMQGRSFTSGLTEGAVAGAVAGASMGVLSLARAEEEKRRGDGERERRMPFPSPAPSQSQSRVYRSRNGSTLIITSSGGRLQGIPPELFQTIRHYPSGRRAWEGGMDVDQMSYEDLLTRFGAGNERKGAPPSAIDSLPVHSYEKDREHAQTGESKEKDKDKAKDKDKDKDKDLPSCTICLDDFGEGDAIRTLPCFHTYHQPCIDRWLLSNNSCPVCKTPIT